MGESAGASFLGIGLRGSGVLSISSDRLVFAGVTFMTPDITWAGLVDAPDAPMGAPPLPALAWRMTDGRYVTATPAHPHDAWQVLETLFQFRPDLRTPLPPPPPPGALLTSGSQGANALHDATQVSPGQTVMAGIAHLSFFFGGLIVPYIFGKLSRKTAPYVAEQSRQAFYFHACAGVVLIILGIIASTQATPSETSATAAVGFVVSLLVLLAVYAFAAVCSIIGAVKAFNGQPFHYPLMAGV